MAHFLKKINDMLEYNPLYMQSDFSCNLGVTKVSVVKNLLRRGAAIAQWIHLRHP